MKFHLYLIFILWVSSVIAREGSEVITIPSGKIKLCQKFGFFNGGEASIIASTGSQLDLKLYGCTEEASKQVNIQLLIIFDNYSLFTVINVPSWS